MRIAQWGILTEQGSSPFNFTSFISLNVKNEGRVLSYPTEEGQFFAYNKVQTPLDVRVVAALQGTEDEFEALLKQLDFYQGEPEILYVLTPAAYYGPLTLEVYYNKREQRDGAHVIVVELDFTEVKQVQTRVTSTVITKPKNPTSSDNDNTGKTQTQEPRRSVLDRVFS